MVFQAYGLEVCQRRVALEVVRRYTVWTWFPLRFCAVSS